MASAKEHMISLAGIPLLIKLTISVSAKTLNWLKEQHFPGNVREIKNLVERTWLMSGKKELTISDFEKVMENNSAPANNEKLPAAGTMTLDEIEKKMILKAMKFHKNNISKVARSLGISRGALYRRLEKHGIDYESQSE